MAGKEYRLGMLITLRDKMTLGLEKMNSAANKAKASLDKLNKAKVSPTIKLNDQVTNNIKTIEGKLKSLGSMSIRIGGVAAAGAATGLGYGLKLAGEMEQANIAFETMLGSADKAKQFMEDLTDFAVKTPFEMPQLRDASKKILAYGFEAEKIIPMLTAIGDAASGLSLGQEGIDRIVIALGQIRAKSKVQAQEMLQLTEANIPAWEILAEKMGKSTAEVMKLSERGLLPANEAIDMLLEGMGELFPLMMAKQSRSLFGLISSLKDFANLNFFYAFGEGIRQAAVPALQKFVDMLDKNKDGIKIIKERLESLGRTIGTSVVSKFEKLYNWIQTLENDEKFKNMNWGDKFIYVIDQGLTALDDWITKGEGQGKLDSIISKIAEIAAESWFKAEQKMLTMGIKNIGEGNYAAGAGELFAANKLSGGLLGMGAGYLGVNLLGWLGKKGGGKLISLLSGAGKAAGATDAVALLASLQGGGGAAAGTVGATGILAPIVGIASSVLWGGYNMHRAAEAKTKGDNAGYWLDLYAGINPFAYLASNARDNWIDWQHPAAQSVTGTTADTNLALDAISRGGEEQNKLTDKVQEGTQAMDIFSAATGKGAGFQDMTNNSMLSLILGVNSASLSLFRFSDRLNAITVNPTEKHAFGGILTRPHLGLVAEAGPEAIIPLSSRMRSRALNLWQQAGQYLGVRPYASGGFAGPVPAMAGGGGLVVNSTTYVNWGPDEDALALKIGRKIVQDIKQALQNRP